MAFAGFLYLVWGASGLALWGLWLSGHEPPSPVWFSPEAFGLAGEARGWLRVGQAFGVLLLPGLGSAAPAPGFWAPNIHVRRRR